MRNRLWQQQLLKVVLHGVDKTLRLTSLFNLPLHLATAQSDVLIVTALGLFKFA